jgi:SOS-response transcriptional repressor LexA
MSTGIIQKIRDELENGVSAPDLTARQAEVLTYILQCWMSGYMATVREVAEEFGFKSPNAVAVNLTAFRKKGYMEDDKLGMVLTDKALTLVL